MARAVNPRRVVTARTPFGGRTIRWRWTDCAGDEWEGGTIYDQDGHLVGLDEHPPGCVAGVDFTCPVHGPTRVIAL